MYKQTIDMNNILRKSDLMLNQADRIGHSWTIHLRAQKLQSPQFLFRCIPCCELETEQRWRSGDRARLPPMWPGFDSRTRCHKWVKFVVGSRPCSEGFSPGSPVFLPPQKSAFLNSNSIGNSRATGLSVAWLLCVTLRKTKLIYYLF